MQGNNIKKSENEKKDEKSNDKLKELKEEEIKIKNTEDEKEHEPKNDMKKEGDKIIDCEKEEDIAQLKEEKKGNKKNVFMNEGKQFKSILINNNNENINNNGNINTAINENRGDEINANNNTNNFINIVENNNGNENNSANNNEENGSKSISSFSIKEKKILRTKSFDSLSSIQMNRSKHSFSCYSPFDSTFTEKSIVKTLNNLSQGNNYII